MWRAPLVVVMVLAQSSHQSEEPVVRFTGCEDAAVMIFAPYPGSEDFKQLRAQGKVEMGEEVVKARKKTRKRR